MTKLLVFLVLCVASASCVELENLCSSDHFGYNGGLVNAFYRERWNITFPSLSYYLINSSVTCDRSEFVNKTNFLEVLKIKNNFNRKFAEFYTNDLKDATGDEFEDKRWKLSINYWGPLYDMSKVEIKSKCVKTFKKKTRSAFSVFETLARISKDNGYPIWDESGHKPANREAIKILEGLFEKLNAAGDGQTFALKGEIPFELYFRRGFVLPREFKFLTGDSVQPDTKSMAIYEQLLPFNSRQHTDEGCVPVEELPLFYKNKGKD